MILISYDGSLDSIAAIDHAAQLMPGAYATVVTVWEPFTDTMTRTGSAGFAMGMTGTCDVEALDDASRKAAGVTAAEGAQRARLAGLVAEAKCVQHHYGVAHALIEAAAEVDANVIVIGSRGLGGLKSFVLGSVSHGVVQQSDRPVLVVPSATVTEHRRTEIDRERVVA